MIDLYSSPTSNGLKITILLELLGLEYNYHYIDIDAKQNKEPWFLELNPGSTIPVLKDSKTSPPTILHESIVITQYIVDTYDTQRLYSYTHDHELWYEQLQWLIWHASNVPFQYELHYYMTFAPPPMTQQESKDREYCIHKFSREAKQLFGVMEQRLKKNNGWFIGDGLNVVDIVIFPWIKRAYAGGLDQLEEWDGLMKWRDKIDKIDGVQKGMIIGV